MVTATPLDRAIDAKRIAYRRDPIGFAVNVLGMREDYIWPKMVELAEGVRDHQKVCVRAGHFVSKTYSLGRIIVPWYKTCFLPSTVVTTAPSDNQVRNQLWREIHAAYESSLVPLGGKMTTLQWDMKPSKEVLDSLRPEMRANWEKNFAIGFSTSPDSAAEHATKMQGWHNEYVLVVIDEGCGMATQIWRTAIEGLINDDQCKVVVIGNPTDPECDMAKACYSSDTDKNEGKEPYISDKGWYIITIDARDNPNYQQRRRVIPGLASYEWVQSIFKEYGEDGDSARYRVKGLFPTYKEGTYYGKKLAAVRKDRRIGAFPADPTAPVYTFSDYGDMYTATIFVQFIQGRIRIIGEYWDYEGKGAPAWTAMCDDRCKAGKYHYRGHWAGPDLTRSNKQSFATGRTIVDTLRDLGYVVWSVQSHSFDDGIEAGRALWSLIEIDEESCPSFIKAAAGYGKEKNQRLSTDEQVVYHNQPAKTWHCHMMDAYRHLAMQYRYGKIGDKVLGYKPPQDTDPRIAQPEEDDNLLSLSGLGIQTQGAW